MDTKEIVIAIIFPVILWLITPKQLKELISKKVFRKRNENIECMLDELNKIGLTIVKEELLSMEYFVKKKKYVYFPVVPRDKFNVIHYTFSYVIKALESLGLKVIIFVFDDYYAKVKDIDDEVRKSHIKNFTNYFRKTGVNSRIIYESKINKKLNYLKRLNRTITNLKSIYTIADVAKINKFNKYISDDTKYIRYEKIFYNEAHFINLKYDFGYILSGNDETEMWTKFVEIYGKQVKSNFTEVVLLSIPKLYNIKGELSNVLDVLSLTYTNSYEDIVQFVKNNLKYKALIQKNCGFFYLLTNVYFREHDSIEIEYADNISKKIGTVEELITFCETNDMYSDDLFCKSISHIIFNLFHLKEEE